MANRIEPIVHYLREVVRPREDVRVTDGQLLSRFVAGRDETAFEALVRRHGGMVFAVCLRLTGNRADAEDAFQATFLVFVRKAAAISSRETVGNWLFGVAYRTALHSRSRTRQRQDREEPVRDMAQPASASDEEWRKLVPLLDQELRRLPDKYRVPVVLCELEGRSRKEVARELKLPEGTLSSRLATARKLLARRLARYGPVSSAALAAALSEAASAAAPPVLISLTTKAMPATVTALAEGVVKAMFIGKLKTVSWLVALAVTVGAGVVGVRVVTAQAPTAAGAEEPSGARGVRFVATARPLRDELEVLRLEIEALRKDLKITKDRVETLETELGGLKGQAKGSAASTGKRLAIDIYGESVPKSQPNAADSGARKGQVTGGEASTTKLQAVRPKQAGADGKQSGEKQNDGKQGGEKQNDGKQGGEKQNDGKQGGEKQNHETWIESQDFSNPSAHFDQALKDVQQNPADKQALKALDAAAQRLKKSQRVFRGVDGKVRVEHHPLAVEWLTAEQRKAEKAFQLKSVEAALAKLREQPDDQKALEALERAVRELKSATPAVPKPGQHSK